jgi:hypothetical protein
MWLQDLGPFLTGLAAVIAAFTPLLAVLRKKDGTPLLPLPGDPLGWARASTWTAGVAFALAFAVIIYGLAESNPAMSSTPVVRFRLLIAVMGLLTVSTGAWSVVTGWHQDPKGYQSVRIGAATLGSGFLVLAGMLVIALSWRHRRHLDRRRWQDPDPWPHRCPAAPHR